MQNIWISITPESNEQNLRLDQYLASRYPQFSRTHWKHRIRSKQVLINSKVAKPHERISAHCIVSYLVKRRSEPVVNSDIKLIYDNEGLLVVNKPADLPVHPGGSYFKGTLIEILKDKYGFDYLAPIHRLDRETSGVMLLCTQRTTASQYSRWLKDGLFQKLYL